METSFHPPPHKRTGADIDVTVSDRVARLCGEHLEEASFLYDQLTNAEPDPELTWLDRADDEERLEAHLDALVIGGDIALAVCAQQAVEGDAGELYAAVCTFCRQDDTERFDAVLDDLDPGDEERVRAVADALCDEAPGEWQDVVAALLDADDPPLQRIGARVLGYRRWSGRAEQLVNLLSSDDDAVVETAAWALGRLGVDAARQPLFRLLEHGNPGVCQTAALALLRLREPAAISFCARKADSATWSLIPLGLAGAPSHRLSLQDAASSEDASPESLLALSLLGDPAAVELLLYQLADDRSAEPAAEALHLLTGAGLTETVFVPEEIDEDELFDDELEAYRRGELPTRANGQPYGTEVTRLTQNADTWRAWWTDHKRHFLTGNRYVLGAPHSPAALLAGLAAPSTPSPLRPLLLEALAVCYGICPALELRMTVSQQHHALRLLSNDVEAASGRLRSGAWLFHGRPHSPRHPR